MQSKLVGSWLMGLSLGAYGLVLLGGYTRLKRAGLSMVEWKPHSLWYPRSTKSWEEQFAVYQEYPEYKASPLDLGEFKEIYFIEWAHRMSARALGVGLVVPMLLFWKRGFFTREFSRKMLVLSGLFGLQGGLGWWMVRSGLEHKETGNRVAVAPTRLAVHLATGTTIFGYMFWNSLTCLKKMPSAQSKELLASLKRVRGPLVGLLHLTFTTVVLGGLVAGSDAGKELGNWPFYGKDIVFPEKAWTLDPGYRNFYENPAMIQFMHRTSGYLTWLAAVGLFMRRNTPGLSRGTRVGIWGVFGLVNLQVLLGIAALWRGCRLEESLTHQGNAILLVSVILATLHSVRKPPRLF